MYLSHVDCTGYPTDAWKYLIKAVTMGGSYALYAANVACLVFLVIVGRFYSPGCRSVCHSLGPVASRRPVSTAVPCLSLTMTASRVKVTAQSASHRVPTLIKLWPKPGIRFPFIGNSDEVWGKARLPVPEYCWVCPFAVPTVTFGVARSILKTGASVAKYMLVAPDYTTPGAFFGSSRCWLVCLDLIFIMFGKVKVSMSWVGLKLSV